MCEHHGKATLRLLGDAQDVSVLVMHAAMSFDIFKCSFFVFVFFFPVLTDICRAVLGSIHFFQGTLRYGLRVDRLDINSRGSRWLYC